MVLEVLTLTDFNLEKKKEDGYEGAGERLSEFNQAQIELIADVVNAGIPQTDDPKDIFLFTEAYYFKYLEYLGQEEFGL